MDRADAEQEGITLPPLETTRFIARNEAEKVILQHLNLCPFAALKIEERLRVIETRFATLVGIMIGSGLLGGVAGAAFSRLLGK